MSESKLTLAPDSSAHFVDGVWVPGHLIAAKSVAEAAFLALGEHPATPFVYSDETGWLSRGEFLQRSMRVAANLLSWGLGRGDRLLICAPGSVDFAAIYLGALFAGGVVVTANPAYTERELAHVIADSRPAIVVADPRRLIALRELASSRQSHAAFVGPGQELPIPQKPIECRSVEEVAAESEAASFSFRPRDLAGETPALIAYTSGTTGVPKGALLSHANLLASVKGVVQAWRWTDSDRLMLALPLFHVHGLGVGLTGSLCVGSSILLYGSFDAGLLVAAVQGEFAPTMYFGVPATYARLVEAAGFDAFSKLRLMVSGSAPLAPELFERIVSLTGQAPIERYGMSETLMNVSNPYVGLRKKGSVGVPLPGVTVALSDKGEILVRGDNVFGGYLGNPVASSVALAEGWMHTGDVGSLDDDGYLRIESRLTDMIISGGFNVYPREVEEEIRSYPGVGDAAVVGRESALWGEEVVAFIIASDPTVGIDAGALLDYLASRLVNYKIPKRVFFVEEFPRNAMGKVLGASLRELAQKLN